MRKPRKDSKLKTLPDQTMGQIFAWCADGYETAIDRIADELHIQTSAAALSDFFHWYQLKLRFEQAENRSRQIVEMVQNMDPSMAPERVRQFGQAVFTLEAVDKGDAKTFRSLEELKLAQEIAESRGKLDTERVALLRARVDLGKERIALDREKWETQICEQFLAWQKDKAAQDIAAAEGLTNAEKISRLREKYFADVDAAEAAGEVRLPE